MEISALSLICVFLIACVKGLLAWKRSRGLPLPPSPSSATKVSPDQPWKTYAKWSKSLRLGPIVSLPGFGRLVVVINSTEVAIDLLEKRSIYACKPRWPMAELVGRQHNVGFQYYGERLKKSRKILHACLNSTAIATTWSPLLEAQTAKLINGLLLSPETFYSDVHRNMEDMVIRLAYGHAPQPEYIELAKEVMRQTGEALQPGKWMVNFIPALVYVPSWMPYASFQRWAKDAKDMFYLMTRTPFYQVKHEMVQGIAGPSFVRQALENLGAQPSTEEEDVVMSAAGSLYSAGTETLTASILSFLLLMARHPEVQERAHQEILMSVGQHCIPGLQDRESLPYIDCIIQEVHRLNPAIPLITHSNMVDDEYHGHRIPKKTWIMANVWSMLHNEDVYVEAETFNPDRFLPHQGHPTPRDPRTLVFGFGRRLCPGIHLANTIVYLAVVRILALFEISPEVQEGKLHKPPLEFMTGLVSTPKPFYCSIKPRPGMTDLLPLH